jgi:hypothetical protein
VETEPYAVHNQSHSAELNLPPLSVSVFGRRG